MNAQPLAAPDRPKWYVIQTKPRQESRALENLERQAFTCFLPKLKVERLRSGQKLRIEEPLFPGYLFIHLDTWRDNWHSIRSTRGVNHIVRFDEYPTAASDQLIEGIRARIEERPVVVPYLEPGDPVRVTEGPFANLDAIFVANDGEQRVVLLMNILHSEQSLSFPVSAVRKAPRE